MMLQHEMNYSVTNLTVVYNVIKNGKPLTSIMFLAQVIYLKLIRFARTETISDSIWGDLG